LLPALLKPLGYQTHAVGRWDVGFVEKHCSGTYRGFDTFFGYYTAREADYWYHGTSYALWWRGPRRTWTR
jgi:arylsulfatase A-like enzyme